MKNTVFPHKFWRPFLDCMPQLFLRPQYVWFPVHLKGHLIPLCYETLVVNWQNWLFTLFHQSRSVLSPNPIHNQVGYASSEIHDSTQRKEIFPPTKTHCSFNKDFARLLILMQCINKLYLGGSFPGFSRILIDPLVTGSDCDIHACLQGLPMDNTVDLYSESSCRDTHVSWLRKQLPVTVLKLMTVQVASRKQCQKHVGCWTLMISV